MPTTPTVEHWRRREFAYPLLAPVVSALVAVLFRVHVRGSDHLPRAGAAIVVANHVSHLDTILLLSVLWRHGRRARFLALADLWRIPAIGWLLHHGRMIPVNRGGPPARMLAAAEMALAAHQMIVVYPEGRLVDPGERVPAQRGAGLLALRSGCPILPVAMHNVPPWSGWFPPLRHPVEVTIGAPLQVAGPPDDRGAQLRASQLALDTVRSLLRDGE